MSQAKDPLEQSFAAARRLPAALDRQEVALLLLNPPPPPPATSWFSGWAKRFLMLISVIATMLTLLLNFPAGTPALTSFPITATTTPAISALERPVINRPVVSTAEQQPNIKAQLTTLPSTTQLTSPAISPSLAPATSPHSLPPNTIEDAPAPATTSPSTETKQANIGQRSGQLPPALFSGDWRLKDHTLRVVVTEVSGAREGQKYYLPIILSAAELAILKQKAAPTNKIERAAGTLLLSGSKRKGSFEFVPNPTYRQQLNDAGMGDANFSLEGDRRSPIVIDGLLMSPAAPPNDAYPRDLLWFKYFISDVNDDYFQLLYDHGYTKADLQEFNHLPYYTVNLPLLKKLLVTTDKLFTEKVPLKDLAPMSWRLAYLNGLLFDPSTPMSLEQFRQSEQEKGPRLGVQYLLDPQDSLKRKMVGLLKQQDSITFLNDSVFLLFDSPSSQQGVPDDWGLNTPDRITLPLNLKPFSTLKLNGRVRLFLNYSDGPQQVTIYCSPAQEKQLRVRQSGRQLKIKKRNAKDWIDIEIKGPKLRLYSSKGMLSTYHPK
ncbi:MAG: hypothetical protein AAF840_03390 [Bacteroidota bacterium]